MISKNGIALGVLIVEALLSAIGVEFEPGTAEKVVEGFFVTVALIVAIYNQLNRPDVAGFFFKK